ncbi:hypothetical protein [Arsenicibacter rosenii]|nr:hypothetical protein [Arsenicibacter rosenii]
MLIFTIAGNAQSPDSLHTVRSVAGGVSVTNNGISLLPTFALGKPAAIFDLSMGGKRLSFEPQFRFSLEGKPWSFLFWWRYRLVSTAKWQIGLGAHPAIAFKTGKPVNETEPQPLVAKRFLAGEISPNYTINQHVSVGLYYLYSHGYDTGVTRNTHFLALRTNLSGLTILKAVSLRMSPQLYYLKLDQEAGVFITSSFTLTKKGFPVSIQSIVNQQIRSDITAGKPFVWNVSLIYSFQRTYTRV